MSKYRGRGTLLYPPSIFYQFNPLSILLIVNHRNAASADCIEMRAAEHLSVGLQLEAAILKGSGHTPEVGIGDIVLRYKIVNVHANHLSKPGFLSVLPPGEIIPWN